MDALLDSPVDVRKARTSSRQHAHDAAEASAAPSRWRRRFGEWEFWLLAALAVAIYGSRMTTLPIHGEETRRAEVAVEMVRTGDWVVPRQQNEPFLSRPPLQCWPIATLMALTGGTSLWAARLPSVLATILTTLLIYGYGRQFLSRTGAFAAGLVYATTGMILQMGRLAETDAVFTLLVAASLLVWHWGYAQNWRRSWTWMAGYGLAGLGALAKGPQAPVYFTAVVMVFLICQRDWRAIFSWAHLGGMAMFAAVVAAWQVPFWMQLGFPAVREIWTGDVAMRFEDMRLAAIGLHILLYPVETLVCMLPWAPLLSAFAFRGFRESVKQVKPWVQFLTVSLLVTFPTCWLVPGAKGRYWMSLYPCLALLVGLVIQKALEPNARPLMRRGWTAFRAVGAAMVLFTGLIVAGATWVEQFHLAQLVQPAWFAALFLLAAGATFVALLSNGGGSQGQRTLLPLTALGAFIGLFYVGVVISGMAAGRDNPSAAIASLKHRLPPNVKLVSLGLVETMFTYYYDAPVALQKWPVSEKDVDPHTEYFCFTWDRDFMPPLPFAWEVEGEIPCDKPRSDNPQKRVIVGKRVASVAAGKMRASDGGAPLRRY